MAEKTIEYVQNIIKQSRIEQFNTTTKILVILAAIVTASGWFFSFYHNAHFQFTWTNFGLNIVNGMAVVWLVLFCTVYFFIYQVSAFFLVTVYKKVCPPTKKLSPDTKRTYKRNYVIGGFAEIKKAISPEFFKEQYPLFSMELLSGENNMVVGLSQLIVIVLQLTLWKDYTQGASNNLRWILLVLLIVLLLVLFVVTPWIFRLFRHMLNDRLREIERDDKKKLENQIDSTGE
jgi:hypothetical protein